MKRVLLVYALTIAIIMSTALSALADSRDTGIDAMLYSAESLFKAMKARDYKGIWLYLSDESRATVVKSTYRAIDKAARDAESDVRYSREAVESDFRSGGPIATSYWDGYLQNFNPDWLLEQSKWQIGKVGKDTAEIIIQYHKGQGPVYLRMTAENGKWKVGLVETFQSSKH